MNKTIYVPIGSSCKPTWYLHRKGYRTMAFPFDWTVTPIKSAIKLINNNFEDFLNIENLTFLKPTYRLLFKDDENNPELSEDIVTPVYDKKYHILYVHDFSKKGKTDFSLVKEKYSRRVHRLQKILNDSNNKVCFIYDNSSPNDWQQNQYAQVQYNFIKLSNENINTLFIPKDNIELVSLNDFINKEKK